MSQHWAVVVACALVVVVAGVGAPVSAQQADDTGVPVVVVFDDQSAKNPQAIEASGGRVTGGGRVDVAPVLFANVPAPAREAIANRPGVKAVSRDIEVKTSAQTTDWGVETIGARATATGIDESGVTVAVIDTGVAAGHTDLTGRVNWGVNTVGAGYTQGADAAADGNGHGTHVAGIIAAQNNGQGTVGVAPQAQLYAMKALADDGTGTLSDVIEAIDLSVKGPDDTVGTDDDADVMSLSLGTPTDSPALKDAIAGASEHATIVAAAGNAGDGDAATNTVQYPAKYGETIAVAATDSSDTTPQWSSEGDEVTLAAPGVDVVSTYPGNEYRSLSGTSMATPHVSGTAALYIAATTARTGVEPTGSEVRTALTGAARDIESTGSDPLSGAGLIQANAIDTESPTGEIRTPTAGETVSNNTTITVNASHPTESTASLTVEYAVDDGAWRSLTYNDTTEQFTGEWDTTTVDDGAHRLWVWVGDSNGDSVNMSTSVQVVNTASTPNGSFVTPTDGETVTGTQSIRLNASDRQTPRENLSVSYRINDRAWQSMTYATETGSFTDEWNVTDEEPGKYTVTGYVENEAGVAATTQVVVYVENETAPPGEQFSSIAALVHAELAGELQGRAFGQRIAAAASQQERAAVAAQQQDRLQRQLQETLAEPPSRARDARLQTIQRLSTEQAAVVRSLPASARQSQGLNERSAETMRDRSRAVGVTVTESGPGPVPADRPAQAGGGKDESTDAGDRDRDRDRSEPRGERGPPERPPQGPPESERPGENGERGTPAGQDAGGERGTPAGQSAESEPGQSGETPGDSGSANPGGGDSGARNDGASSGSSNGASASDNAGGGNSGNGNGGADTDAGGGNSGNGNGGASSNAGGGGSGNGNGGADKNAGGGGKNGGGPPGQR